MVKPKLSKDIAMEYIRSAQLKYKIPLNDYPVRFLGLRGYYRDTMGKPGTNDRGIYDDAICIVAPGIFLTYNANTDPSIWRPGIATLVPGIHMYQKGNHKKYRPDGGYPAFRPATPGEVLPVMRDGNIGISEGVAINIHRGGINTTSSEGCQTIEADEWAEFQVTAYHLLDKNNQVKVPYILCEWQQ